MISDLKNQTVFTFRSGNTLISRRKMNCYKEIVEKGYAVKNEGGKMPFEDAVLDMSNPAAVKWYQGKTCRTFENGSRRDQG